MNDLDLERTPLSSQYGSFDLELGDSTPAPRNPILPHFCDTMESASLLVTWTLVTTLCVVAMLCVAEWKSTIETASQFFWFANRIQKRQL